MKVHIDSEYILISWLVNDKIFVKKQQKIGEIKMRETNKIRYVHAPCNGVLNIITYPSNKLIKKYEVIAIINGIIYHTNNI